MAYLTAAVAGLALVDVGMLLTGLALATTYGALVLVEARAMRRARDGGRLSDPVDGAGGDVTT